MATIRMTLFHQPGMTKRSISIYIRSAKLYALRFHLVIQYTLKPQGFGLSFTALVCMYFGTVYRETIKHKAHTGINICSTIHGTKSALQ